MDVSGFVIIEIDDLMSMRAKNRHHG